MNIIYGTTISCSDDDDVFVAHVPVAAAHIVRADFPGNTLSNLDCANCLWIEATENNGHPIHGTRGRQHEGGCL